MSPHTKGSAAGATRRRPTSADEQRLAARREGLRRDLPAQLSRLQRALDLASGALSGPDPEAAFGYLEILDEQLQALIASNR